MTVEKNFEGISARIFDYLKFPGDMSKKADGSLFISLSWGTPRGVGG